MSVHPSLSTKSKGKRNRSVLKRFERLKEMIEKEKWKVGDSIFGLPKVKVLRLKLKKAKKPQEEEAEATAEGVSRTAGEEAQPKKEEKAEKKEKKTEKK